MALALGMGAMPAGHAFRYPDLRYRRIEPALEPDRQCAGRAGAMAQMVATFAATGGYAG